MGSVAVRHSQHSAWNKERISNARFKALLEGLRRENAGLHKELQNYKLRRAQANVQILRIVEFNNQVLGNLNFGLLVLDPKDLVTLINRRAAEMLEVDPRRAKGRPLLWELADKGVLNSSFLKALESNLKSLRGETLLKFSGGRERWISYDASELAGPAGNREGLLVLLADLTREREERARLQRQEHLATVGRLSADIAHQIQNPLAGMESLLQVSLSKLSDTPQVRKNLEMVLEEARKLHHLVSDTLHFARPAALSAQRIQLNEVAEEALSLAAPASRWKINRAFKAPSPEVLADRTQLREVILNLVRNGLEAMPLGGTLSVRTGIKHPRGSKKQQVFIQVRDSGLGIPPAVAEHIFDSFFTTKAEGSGLGLPTCRRIVDSLEGKILFSTQPRKGTEFTVWLPGLE
jgi:signal transduction histidine kinase